jgi:beta-phosphoglucomutase-like phosphatase (HAD superfamily)
MNDIEAIIFDFDDTLVETLPIHFFCYQQIFKFYDMELEEEKYYRSIGGKSIDVIPKLIGDQKCPVSIEKLHFDKTQILMTYAKNKEINSLETAKLLPLFYGKYKMAIASSGTNEFIQEVVAYKNWNKYFDTILSSKDVKNGKPDPEVFLLAASNMNVNPENCLVFEDGLDGIEAARRAGMQFFDVKKAHTNRWKDF